LVEAYPDQRERMLTRWAFLGSLGDAVAPAFVATSFAITGSWRGALAAAAAGYALHGAWVLATMPDNRPAASSDDDGDESLRTALARGLKNPSLMSWLGATALCTLLDEILLAFGSLYLREVHGASPALQATAFTAFAIGCGVGLLLTDRALTRVPPERVLIASCIVCIAAYAAWLAIDSSIASVLLLGLVGLGTGPLHPLAQARAYAAHAERPGVVAALEMLYSPIELLAPLIIGAFADRYGLGPALALLALQPIAILAMAWSARTHRSAPA
jgi:predicted MFS family arabinose efflux permease